MLGIPKGSPLEGKIALIVLFSFFGGCSLFCFAVLGYELFIIGCVAPETIINALIFSPLILFGLWLAWSHGLKYWWLFYQVIDYAKKNKYVDAETLVEKKLSSPKNIQRIQALSLKPPYVFRINCVVFERDWHYHLKMLLEVEKKNYHKALEYVDEMIKLEPINPKAWYNKACLQCLSGDQSSALGSLNSLKKVITSNPKLSKKIFEIAKKDEDFKVLCDNNEFKEIVGVSRG